LKKLLLTITAFGLMLGISGAAFGAVHSTNGDFINWSTGEMNFSVNGLFALYTGKAADTWYTVAPEINVFKAEVMSSDGFSSYGGEFILNDQTFAGLNVFNDIGMVGPPIDSLTNLRASYLFDFGLFVGIDYYALDGGSYDSLYTISPGYRFGFGDDNYVALSLDYMVNPDMDFAEIVGYDLDIVYFFAGGRFFFQYYSATDEAQMMRDTAYDLGVVFQVADEVVIGANYYNVEDSSDYSVGLTWTPDFMVLDLQIGTFMEESNYALSALFSIGANWALGLGYESFEPFSDDKTIFKVKYMNDSSKLIFGYVLENDSYPASYLLGYTLAF
jgi:hypothetical protein